MCSSDLRFNEAQRVMVVMNNEKSEAHFDPQRYLQGLGGATLAKNALTGEQHKLADHILIPAKSAQIYELN